MLLTANTCSPNLFAAVKFPSTTHSLAGYFALPRSLNWCTDELYFSSLLRTRVSTTNSSDKPMTSHFLTSQRLRE